MFAGAGLKQHAVSRQVTPYDIAPTLAAYLGIKPPSGSVGEPLVEVVAD
jgi:arylsulfatase A-like enzyme